MNNFLVRIKEQPALATQAVQALLSLLVAFEIFHLNDDQTGAILAFTAAGLGFIIAISVRPFRWSAVTGLVQAGIILLAAFGIDLTSQQTASISAVVAVVGAFIMQQASTPETHLPALAGVKRGIFSARGRIG